MTTLVTGVVAPRLAGDAVLDLWDRVAGADSADRTAAGAELVAAVTQVEGWYARLGRALTGRGQVPEAAHRDVDTDARLIAAVRRDLADHEGLGTPTAVRMIWTGDHLDAVRRLQESLISPARAVARPG